MDSNGPVAWAVHYGLDPDPEVHWELYPRHAAESGHMIVPLYSQPQPALTDEEREALTFILRHAAVAADGSAFHDSADYQKHHDAVFALLERTQRRS